jgi:hypothetical protein
MSPERIDEAARERRLEREAQELLATIGSPEWAQCARVDVTYQTAGYEEHAGHLIVWVPSGADPWIAAREAAQAWLDKGKYEYDSIDDITSA